MGIRRRSILYGIGTAAADGGTSAGAAGYTFAVLDAERLDRAPICALRGRAAKFRDRLAQGYGCVGYLDDKGIVRSYVWIAGGKGRPVEVPVWRGLRWQLPEGNVYFWDCRTDAAHEGRGLYRSALRLAAAQAAQDGMPAAWIESEVGNAASDRGIQAAGFAPVVQIDAWHFLSVTFWRADAGLPRLACGPVRLSAVCGVASRQ